MRIQYSRHNDFMPFMLGGKKISINTSTQKVPREVRIHVSDEAPGSGQERSFASVVLSRAEVKQIAKAMGII